MRPSADSCVGSSRANGPDGLPAPFHRIDYGESQLRFLSPRKAQGLCLGFVQTYGIRKTKQTTIIFELISIFTEPDLSSNHRMCNRGVTLPSARRLPEGPAESPAGADATEPRREPREAAVDPGLQKRNQSIVIVVL